MRRIDRARTILTGELLPALSGQFRVEVLGFGAGLAPIAADALTASAPRSDLTAALADVAERFRGRTAAGIVVLSDGGDTNQEGQQTAAPAMPPVFALGLGTTTVGRDREVLSVTAAEAVLDRSRVDLAVSAVSHGHGTAPIELRLLENGRPLEVRRAAPAADGIPVRETFQVTPAAGAPSVYTIEIPAGVATGQYMTLRGAGNAGLRGGGRGDVLVVFEVTEDARFERDGDDLYCEVLATYPQLVLGADLEVPGIAGAISLRIPQGTQSGQVFHLRGRGLPRVNASGTGDLHVRVQLWTPSEPSAEEKALVKNLAELQSKPPASRERERGFWARMKEALGA